MTYEMFIPTWLFYTLLIYTAWFLLPLLLRIKETMVGERKQKLPWILYALTISIVFLLTAFAVRGLASAFYTIYDWLMLLTAKMLGAIISDEKP